MDISKIMKAFITVTQYQGDDQKRPYKIDVANISFIEALYDSDEELKEMRESCYDLSQIFVDSHDGLRCIETQQTLEEIEALIEAAEDKRMERLNKFRIGIR